MRCLVIAMLALNLFDMAAWGDAPADRPAPVAKDNHAKICAPFYPSGALRNHRDGQAAVLFSVTAEGNVTAVVIAVSSGYSDIDFAAAACATRWHYEPAMKDGVAFAATSSGSVGWWEPPGGPPVVPQILLPASNCILNFGGASDPSKTTGPTVVRYALDRGTVTGVALGRSSGIDALDSHVARCVMTWRFNPVMSDGKSATGTFDAIVDWQQKPPPEF